MTPVCLRALMVMLMALSAAPARAQAVAEQSEASAASGGSEYGTQYPADTPTVPGTVAKVVDGLAHAPEAAPGDFEDDGYDCSGTVSFGLHGGDLLARPRDSSSCFRYGAAGKGSWITTIHTRSSHMYMTVAGIRLDTSAADDRGGLKGPRRRPRRRSDKGFEVRHPVGL